MVFLAHLWDELDDVTWACRHLATAAASEMLAPAAPVIATLGAALLAGAAALVLAQHQIANFLA